MPPERRALYHAGQLAMALGVLVFAGNMWRMACTADDGFGAFAAGRAQRDVGTSTAIALTGMALCLAGGLLMSVARRGVAGAGLVLDPERAREELEPFSRQAGGMLKDALDEADLTRRGVVEVVRVRCAQCAALEDEHARFCSACGAPFPTAAT